MTYGIVVARIGGQAPFDFYPYNPSGIAGWIFVVLFGIGSLVHVVIMFPYRAWFFIPFILGCISENKYGSATSPFYVKLTDDNQAKLVATMADHKRMTTFVARILSCYNSSLSLERHLYSRPQFT